MEAPPKNFAYTVLLSPDFSKPDALAVIDVNPNSPDLQPGRSHRDDAQQGRRISPFWMERLFVGAVAADRARFPRTPLSASSPACAPSRIYIVDTKPHPTKAKRSTRSSSRKKSSGRPDTRVPTRFIAGRKAFTSLRSAAAARTAPTDRPASSSWTARRSRCSGAGSSIAVRRPCIMISGGICRATTW